VTTASPTPPRTDRRPAAVLRVLGIQATRIVLALFFAFPIIFMLVSSFKPDQQIFADLGTIKAFLPVGHLSLANYAGVFDRVPAARFLLNSIGISAVTVVLGIFVNSLAAFALSRMRWRGKKIVLSALIATLIVPFETFALPMVWWVNKLPWLQMNGFHPTLTEGWLDTYQVQILPFVANAFSIFLFHQYFQSIPKELDEAAFIDGAGWFGIYRRIVMPLSGPAIATVAILAPHGHPERGPAAGHGRHPVLLPARRLLGPDHGLRLHDHRAGTRTVPGLPAVLHQQHRFQRRQRLTPVRPPPRPRPGSAPLLTPRSLRTPERHSCVRVAR
jgi:multiple sugar transport system permease protein